MKLRIKDSGHTNAVRVDVPDTTIVGDLAQTIAVERKVATGKLFSLKRQGDGNNDAFRRAENLLLAGAKDGDLLELVETFLDDPDYVAAPEPGKKPVRKQPAKKTTARKSTAPKKRGGGRSRKSAAPMVSTPVDLVQAAGFIMSRQVELENIIRSARDVHAKLGEVLSAFDELEAGKGAA